MAASPRLIFVRGKGKMADGELASDGCSQRPFPHVLCRRLSSSSESGFNSDISDEHNASPSSVTDEAVQRLNG